MGAAADRPLRVLQVTEATSGGVRRHLQLLTPELRKRGLDITLVVSLRRAAPDFEQDVREWRRMGCGVVSVPMRRTPHPGDIPAVRRVRAVIRRHAPCVVHAHAWKAGVLCRLAAGRAVPVIYSPHAFSFQGVRNPLVRTLLVWTERALAGRTARWVVTSESEAVLARNLAGATGERIRVIPNGLPPAPDVLPQAQARGMLGLPKNATIVGFVGRLCFQKAPEVLVRALASPGMRDAEGVHAAFIGDGPLRRRLERLTERLNLTGRVHFSGYQPEAARFMPAFDLLVLPSRYEGLAYTLLEAMRAGRGIVVSDIPGNHLDPRVDALLRYFPVGSAEGLGHVLGGALADRDWQRRCRTELPDLVRSLFPLEKQVDALVATYADVLSGCGGRLDVTDDTR